MNIRMHNTNLTHTVNDSLTFAQFARVSVCSHANRSIDISPYFVFGTQIVISKFHLNHIICDNDVLQNTKMFQVIQFNLNRTEVSHS